jgi:Neuraminidase (sialidase)
MFAATTTALSAVVVVVGLGLARWARCREALEPSIKRARLLARRHSPAKGHGPLFCLFPQRLALVLFFAALSNTVVAGAPTSQPAPRIVSRCEVFRYSRADPYDLQNLYGFNHAPSVVRLSDGRLCAAWFSGPFEASVHQVIFGCYSSDEGATWSAGQVLQDTPHTSDFDPAFVADADQTWLFYTVGRWNRYPFVGPHGREAEEVGVKSFKLMSRSTVDGGRTWSEPRRMLDVTGHGEVLKSTDRGKTWKLSGHVAPPGKVGAAEPTIAELSGGRVLMAVRSNDGFLWMSTSSDRGETWSEPHKTDLIASASSHNLFRLADGRIALTRDECPPAKRTLLTMRISGDEGATWGDPLTLAELKDPPDQKDLWSQEVCYPSVAQLPDGTLVVVWAWIEMSPDSQRGVIESARVSVPKQ